MFALIFSRLGANHCILVGGVPIRRDTVRHQLDDFLAGRHFRRGLVELSVSAYSHNLDRVLCLLDDLVLRKLLNV